MEHWNVVISSATVREGEKYLVLVLGFTAGEEGYEQCTPEIWDVSVIREITKMVGVREWHKLVGQYVRVRAKDPYGPISAIGHILTDTWIDVWDFWWFVKK